MTDGEVAEVQRILERTATRLCPFDAWGRRDDLVQAAWLALLAGPTFDPDRGIPWGAFVAQRGRWAMQQQLREAVAVGVNRQLPGGRRQAPETVPVIEQDLPRVGPALPDVLLRRRLQRAWRRLSARDRETLRVIGEPVPVVAARLGLSIHGIHMRRHQARVRFRRLLEAEGVPR